MDFYVSACKYVHVCVCAHAYVCACVGVCLYVCTITDERDLWVNAIRAEMHREQQRFLAENNKTQFYKIQNWMKAVSNIITHRRAA